MHVIQGLNLDALYFSFECEVWVIFRFEDQILGCIENRLVLFLYLSHTWFVVVLVCPFLALFCRFRIIILIFAFLIFTDYLE